MPQARVPMEVQEAVETIQLFLDTKREKIEKTRGEEILLKNRSKNARSHGEFWPGTISVWYQKALRDEIYRDKASMQAVVDSLMS